MYDPPEPTLVPCEDCDGTGMVFDDGCPVECPRCEGAGERYFDDDDAADLAELDARLDALDALEGR